MTDTLTIRAAFEERYDNAPSPLGAEFDEHVKSMAWQFFESGHRLALTAGSAAPGQASEPAGFGGALAFSLGQSRSASPPATEPTERARFEAYWLKHGADICNKYPSVELAGPGCGGYYQWADTHGAWEMWKAARAKETK